MSESPWFGTNEACRYLNISLRTLYKLIDSDQIAAYKFGRLIRVRQEDLDEYVEDSRIKPGDLSNLYPQPKPKGEPA